LAVVVVAIGAAFVVTSTPRGHKAYADAAAASVHKGVDCEQCHTKPGAFFYPIAKLEALHQFTAKSQDPILGAVLNQSCMRCHKGIRTNPDSANGITVRHEHLIEAGLLCMRCHSTATHTDAVPVGAQTQPSMDQCLVCHNSQAKMDNGRTAADCDTCHEMKAKGSTPTSHTNSDWAKRHGSIGVLSTCNVCHEAKSCRSCHAGIEMPHQTSWLTRHGGRANAYGGDKACRRCHGTTKFCDTCHRIQMPHPNNFVGRHARTAERQGTTTCFNCHVVDNCQACHQAHSNGTPRAHDLFTGIKYKLPATPAATPSALSTEGSE